MFILLEPCSLCIFPFTPSPTVFSYFINYKQKTQQKRPATQATYNFSSIIFITSDNTLKLLKEKWYSGTLNIIKVSL